jgi:hypothetical protein
MDRRSFLKSLAILVTAPAALAVVVKKQLRIPHPPIGILTIKSDLSEEQIAAFRRQWNKQMEGAQAWHTPIIETRLERIRHWFNRHNHVTINGPTSPPG